MHTARLSSVPAPCCSILLSSALQLTVTAELIATIHLILLGICDGSVTSSVTPQPETQTHILFLIPPTDGFVFHLSFLNFPIRASLLFMSQNALICVHRCFAFHHTHYTQCSDNCLIITVRSKRMVDDICCSLKKMGFCFYSSSHW